jgi:hypothetical protein
MKYVNIPSNKDVFRKGRKPRKGLFAPSLLDFKRVA